MAEQIHAVRCPAATGIIPASIAKACPLAIDGAHHCRLDARHVHERAHRPVGVTIGDHHCICRYVWSTGGSIGERAAELGKPDESRDARPEPVRPWPMDRATDVTWHDPQCPCEDTDA